MNFSWAELNSKLWNVHVVFLFNGILFAIRGIHKANPWDFGVQKIILCASHNTLVMFYSIANRVEFASFLVNRLFRNTKYIFHRTFSPVIITLWKVPKEIHNIVVSHLFAPAVFRFFAVQCEIWMKVVSAHRPPKKKKTTLLNENEFGLQKQKPVEPGLTTP